MNAGVPQRKERPRPRPGVADPDADPPTATAAIGPRWATPPPTSCIGGAARDPPRAAVGAVTARSTRRRSSPTRGSRGRSFDEEALAELVHSIREFGLMQPIVVRATRRPGRYQLVMGERRWRAAQAGRAWRTIPAIVRETADDAMLRDALLENIHRAQLNPLEEAAAYQQLLAEFGVTHDELAARSGRVRPSSPTRSGCCGCRSSVQRRVAASVLSAGHARALLGARGRRSSRRSSPRASSPRACRCAPPRRRWRCCAARLPKTAVGAAPQADPHARPPGCC